MRIGEKQIDATIPYVDLDDGDEASITRSEYEALSTLHQELVQKDGDTDVALSERMFGRLLQTLAVELMQGKK